MRNQPDSANAIGSVFDLNSDGKINAQDKSLMRNKPDSSI
jgi:hypothetical protein